MNLVELNQALKNSKDEPTKNVPLLLEWHRRWALALTCMVFAILGFTISAISNRRTAKSGSIVICISTIVIFWTLQVTLESFTRKGHLPAIIGVWATNFLLMAYSLNQLRRASYR